MGSSVAAYWNCTISSECIWTSNPWGLH